MARADSVPALPAFLFFVYMKVSGASFESPDQFLWLVVPLQRGGMKVIENVDTGKR